MKHTYKIFLVVFVASLFTGCNLDINTDPNRVTETTVTGATIFPAAAHEVGQRIATGNMSFLDKWVGYMAASTQYAIDFTETTYTITPSFGDAFWQNHYNVLFDLEKARAKSVEAGDNATAAASMILSTLLWQELVDVYGNCPYTQALDYAKYPRPAYDTGAKIYADLQLKLNDAIALLKAGPIPTTFATIDIVNKGDVTKWIKLANTIKLRLLIRLSETSNDPTADLALIAANGGVLGAGETIGVNPGYTKALNKQSPFYNNYGLTVNDADAAPSLKASNYIVQLLSSLSDDQRVYALYDTIPTKGVVVGQIYGVATIQTDNPATASGCGFGINKSPSQDQWIMTSVESLFLRAEAIERGWNVGGAVTSAAAAYDAAVAESFAWLGVDIVNPDSNVSYLVDNPYQPGLTTGLKNTLLQKYIALCEIAPIQSWSDLRRISFDIIPASIAGYSYVSANPSAAGGGQIPIRLLYAVSEYTTNNANAKAAEAFDAPNPAFGTLTQFNTPVFWDVNGYNN